MLRRKQQAVKHKLAFQLDLPSLIPPQTQAYLATEVIKFFLLNRGLVPTSVDELHRALANYEDEQQAREDARIAAGRPARRIRRPPAAVKRVIKLTNSLHQVSVALQTQLEQHFTEPATGLIALALGSSPARARELYTISFEAPPSRHTETCQKDLNHGSHDRVQVAASRQLLRGLLQNYEHIKAWEDVLPGGTKCHVLMQVTERSWAPQHMVHHAEDMRTAAEQPFAIRGGRPAVFQSRPHLSRALDVNNCTIPLQIHIVISGNPPPVPKHIHNRQATYNMSCATHAINHMATLSQATAALSIADGVAGMNTNQNDDGEQEISVDAEDNGYNVPQPQHPAKRSTELSRGHVLCMGLLPVNHNAMANDNASNTQPRQPDPQTDVVGSSVGTLNALQVICAEHQPDAVVIPVGCQATLQLMAVVGATPIGGSEENTDNVPDAARGLQQQTTYQRIWLQCSVSIKGLKQRTDQAHV